MKAVAMMTPEPKYFAMKNPHSGTPTPRCRLAYTGNAAPVVVRDHAVNAPEIGLRRIPNSEPSSMTKMAETRRPVRPSKPLSEVHAGLAVNVAASGDDAAAD